MARIHFDKMQGSGNDFVLLDNREGIVPDREKVAFVRQVCPRRTGVGADGVIFIEADDDLDFAWHFFNADGSEAEMCGNGARCAAVYARTIGAAASDRMTFRTVAGPIRAALVPGGARVQLTDAASPERIEGLEVEGARTDLYVLNTGVPHAVVPVEDVETAEVVRLGRALRNHPRFAPAGTNVNFMARAATEGVAVRTYERGVEDETLACGTGCVACAIVAARLYGIAPPVVARPRSGEVLRVDFVPGEAAVTGIFLEGPAVRVYEGRLDGPA